MATDNGYSFRSSSKVIEYQVFYKKDFVITSIIILISGLIFGGSLYSEYLAYGLSTDFIIPAFFAAIFFGIFALMVYKNLVKGLRSVRISGRTVSLTYPEEFVEMSESQMVDLSVRKRKDNGKYKGKVKFKSGDGRRFLIVFMLDKPGGKEGYEWFEAIAKKQKSSSY